MALALDEPAERQDSAVVDLRPIGINSGVAIARIESLLESIIDDISALQPPSVAIRSRRSARRQSVPTAQRAVRFPGRTTSEARRFARVVLILQLAHDAIVSGTILTKRNIFYQHQELFESQRTVDELVDDIGRTLGLDRGDMNIVASAKGLAAGNLKFLLQNGTQMDASVGDSGLAIPASACVQGFDVGSARWVLVIEKDATFRSLLSSQYWHRAVCGEGLLVTAKGYPDMATRSFLHSLSSKLPQLPIYILVDFDPDGLNIFHCYLRGTGDILNDASVYNASMTQIGIRSSQLVCARTRPRTTRDVDGDLYVKSLLSINGRETHPISFIDMPTTVTGLSSRDRKVIVDTLKRLDSMSNYCLATATIRRELQIMQMLGCKAEIQALDDCGNLEAWLDAELEAEMGGSV